MAIRIGLTGGIGSGKSVVSRLLEVMGIPVYISDIETRRLMVADDFSIIRDEIVSRLEEAGLSVVSSVSSGAEAVESYEPGMIVLMDIEMESADAGIKATEAILAKDKDARERLAPVRHPLRRGCYRHGT